MKAVVISVLAVAIILSFTKAAAPGDPENPGVKSSKIPGVYLDGDEENFVMIFFSDGRVLTSWWEIPPTLQLEDWHMRGRWTESSNGVVSIVWQAKSTDRLEDLKPKVYKIDAQFEDCLRSPDGSYLMRMGGKTELRDTNARLKNERKVNER